MWTLSFTLNKLNNRYDRPRYHQYHNYAVPNQTNIYCNMPTIVKKINEDLRQIDTSDYTAVTYSMSYYIYHKPYHIRRLLVYPILH